MQHTHHSRHSRCAQRDMPRFAVCVSGDLRGFARLAWFLETRLVVPTRRGGSTVDFFFHVWSNDSPLELEGVAAAQRLSGMVKIVVEPTAQRLNATSATYGWGAHRRMQSSGSFESFRSQWRKVHLCFADAFAHNHANGGSYYDAYVRTRADMLHLVEYDLGAAHQSMLSRVRALGRGSEYVAMQACTAPWPSSVADIYAMATPIAARALGALPTPSEPPCCEKWLEHRLKAMGVVEPPGGADGEHPASCQRAASFRSSPPVAHDGATSSVAIVFFLTRLHTLHLGQRCFTEKMRAKKRLPSTHRSCSQHLGDPSTDPEPEQAMAAEVALLRPWAATLHGPRHADAEDPISRFLSNGTRTAPMTVLSTLTRNIRRSACRCELGAAQPHPQALVSSVG